MQRRTFLTATGFLLAASFSPLLAFDFKKIKIGYLPITDHLLIIAKELFPNSFTAVKFSSWADLSEALRSGAIDGAFMLTPLALKLANDGLKIKALMAAHREGSALTIKKGSIKNTSDLKDKRVAIPSKFSTHYLLLAEFLKQNQISLNDLKLIDMAPPEMPFALQSGQIDAFIVAEPFGTLAKNANFGETFILSGEIQKNHICCIFALKENLIAQNGQNLVQNFIQTAKFINENQKKALEFSQKLLGHKSALISKVISDEKLINYKHLRLEKSDIDAVLSQIKDFGVTNLNLSYENFVDNSFAGEFE